MRLAMAWLLALGACGRSGFDGNADSTLDDAIGDLLLHFEFESDGLLRDRTGGHDGLCQQTCPTPHLDSNRGGTLGLDGAQCMRVADAPDLRPTQFTVSIWAWRLSGTSGAIFSRPFDGASTSQNTMRMGVSGTVTDWGVNGFSVSTPSPGANSWHHYAATHDGDRTDLYIDGVMLGAIGSGPVAYANDSFFIGCDFDGGGAAALFMGYLDSVRFYNRVLAPNEISTLASM